MKKLIFIVLFLSTLTYSQPLLEKQLYSNEYYFNRFVLNPFDMKNFEAITPCLIDNSFTNILINPASITDLQQRYYLYADFRTDAKYFSYDNYAVPLRGISTEKFENVYPDWFTNFVNSSAEIAPKFSLGLITNPVGVFLNKLFVGATFQRISRRAASPIPYPLIIPYDRTFLELHSDLFPYPPNFYPYEKYMDYESNLYSFFSGYKFSDLFSIGIQYSGIEQKISEEPLTIRFDDGVYTANYFYTRQNTYNHNDVTMGLRYHEKSLKIGFKIGVLKPKVEQIYINESEYLWVESPSNRYTGLNKLNQKTMWNKSGYLYYIGSDFLRKVNEKVELLGYFNYHSGKLNISNSENYLSTSFWEYKNYIDDSYWIRDKTSGNIESMIKEFGNDKRADYSVLLGVRFDVSPSFKFSTGIGYFENISYIELQTPGSIRDSLNRYFASNYPSHEYYPEKRYYRLTYEKFIVDWKLKTTKFLYQIPLIFDFILSNRFELSILINNISGGFKSEETYDKLINTRFVQENDSIKTDSGLHTRYSESKTFPIRETTDLITKLRFNLTNKFILNILLDPEILPRPYIAQWFFSLEGRF